MKIGETDRAMLMDEKNFLFLRFLVVSFVVDRCCWIGIFEYYFFDGNFGSFYTNC